MFTVDVNQQHNNNNKSFNVSLVSQRSWVRYPVWPRTVVPPSADSRRAVVRYWRKYVHEILVNRLGGLSLPKKSAVRLTDRPDMTLDVYRARKTTKQRQQCFTRTKAVASLASVVFVSLLHYIACFFHLPF